MYIIFRRDASYCFNLFAIRNEMPSSSLQAEDVVSRVAEGSTRAAQEIDFSSLRSQLGSLPAVSVDIVNVKWC